MLRIYTFLYALLYTLALFLYLPVYLWRIAARGRRGVDLAQRLGRLPEFLRAPPPSGGIWVHAVSVGEVNAVEPLVRALLQAGRQVFISTTTDTGQEQARRLFKASISRGQAAAFYCPVDWKWIYRRWMRRMRPRAVVIAETELWPGFLLAARSMRVPAALVNGRISDRSFRRYRRLRFLFGPLLRTFAALCVQTLEDKKRLLAMGARSSQVHWTGNLKYDYDLPPDGQREQLARQVRAMLGGGPADPHENTETTSGPTLCQPERERRLHGPGESGGPTPASAEQDQPRRRAAVSPSQESQGLTRGRSAESGRRIWVCGSTREGEEALLLDCLLEVRRDFEGLRVVLAPRHPHRCQTVEKLAGEKGLSVLRRSRLEEADSERPPDILLVDTIGDLRYLYQCADVVFVGGSLTEGGGQNILEPAYFGKAVLFGPHMENFREMAASFTEAYAALQVDGPEELSQSLLHLLQDRTAAEWLGRNARKVMRTSQGALQRTLEILAPCLEGGRRPAHDGGSRGDGNNRHSSHHRREGEI